MGKRFFIIGFFYSSSPVFSLPDVPVNQHMFNPIVPLQSFQQQCPLKVWRIRRFTQFHEDRQWFISPLSQCFRNEPENLSLLMTKIIRRLYLDC